MPSDTNPPPKKPKPVKAVVVKTSGGVTVKQTITPKRFFKPNGDEPDRVGANEGHGANNSRSLAI